MIVFLSQTLARPQSAVVWILFYSVFSFSLVVFFFSFAFVLLADPASMLLLLFFARETKKKEQVIHLQTQVSAKLV